MGVCKGRVDHCSKNKAQAAPDSGYSSYQFRRSVFAAALLGASVSCLPYRELQRVQGRVVYIDSSILLRSTEIPNTRKSTTTISLLPLERLG